MFDGSWEEFWWNNITGAHMLVSRVSEALLENKIVILKVPSDLPWRYSMRGAIHEAFQEKTDAKDLVIEAIDIVDDNPEDLDPGRFLLQRFAPSSISKGYREKSGISIQKYIAQKGVIDNRILWIKGMNDASTGKWIDFCKGFAPKSALGGLFVLEIHGEIEPPESRFMELIDFGDCVSSYDVQLFNSFILESEETGTYKSELWKKYISTTAAMVCNVDAEVSERLLQEVDFRKESAIDGIARISAMPEFCRRGAENDSEHVLWLYRHHKMTELNHRVWASQVQVLFPVIEMERIEIIERYGETISNSIDNNNVTQYEDLITDPMDLELGTLCYMMSHRKDGEYLLYIPSDADRERIRFLHECRNLLAHIACCSPEQVSQLLDKEK